MKANITIKMCVAAALGAGMLSSCHIYKKFDMPQDTAMTREYVEAKEAPEIGRAHV